MTPLALALLASTTLVAGCGGRRSEKAADAKAGGKAIAARVVHPERRDLRMTVIQPGTVQAYEATPIYPRISGYVDKYRVDIGARIKLGDAILDMNIPDYDETLKQKEAMSHRAGVQIRVAESMHQAAISTLETTKARLVSADAGVKRAQASYTRWESEYKRLTGLVSERVLNTQVRDETYRQFEESAAVRDQAVAAVSEATSNIGKANADLESAKVAIESARANLSVAEAEERFARVMVSFGHIKAPYDGVVTLRNVSPGDYVQAGTGSNGRPLFVVEQSDPVRVFVGVPELAAGYIKDQDTATIRIQAYPGETRTGKIIRSGFSLNQSSRTLQTEIDIPNPKGFLRPGMYVTASIGIDRKNVFTVPSNAVVFQGGQNYYMYLRDAKKNVAKTQVLIGPADDSRTEVLRRRVGGDSVDKWVDFDGSEEVMIDSVEALNGPQAAPAKK